MKVYFLFGEGGGGGRASFEQGGGEGGRGFWTQNLVYQKWPDQIFPIVNFVFSHYVHFGLGRGGGGFGGGVPPPWFLIILKKPWGGGGFANPPIDFQFLRSPPPPRASCALPEGTICALLPPAPSTEGCRLSSSGGALAAAGPLHTTPAAAHHIPHGARRESSAHRAHSQSPHHGAGAAFYSAPLI